MWLESEKRSGLALPITQDESLAGLDVLGELG